MAVDRVFDPASGIKNAFAQVRPCGHHAEAERAMGFCIFANVAIAGLYARKKYGAERIAVVVICFSRSAAIGWREAMCRSDPRSDFACASTPASTLSRSA